MSWTYPMSEGRWTDMEDQGPIERDLARDLWTPLQIAGFHAISEPLGHDWTVQGFGMMRTYLDPDKTWRLNVYHSSLLVPGVSVIHDHPWHFDSWILSGIFRNVRYEEGTLGWSEGALNMNFSRIETGILSPVGDAGEGGVVPQGTASLSIISEEEYGAGGYYHQEASEIHEARYDDFTVTINRRVKTDHPDHARVFWPIEQEWVSAKPRDATTSEVTSICGGVDWTGDY